MILQAGTSLHVPLTAMPVLPPAIAKASPVKKENIS
jgi:hypothetical protein